MQVSASGDNHYNAKSIAQNMTEIITRKIFFFPAPNALAKCL
jgi:hypothetical protein